MKLLKTLPIILSLSITIMSASAQTDLPKGFKKGSVVLSNGNTMTGYVKDNISSSASLWFLAEPEGKKINYTGADLISAEIEGKIFRCINNDFFEIICDGELAFVRKTSDAAGKIFYNGTNAIVNNGTEGNKGDYFIYTGNKELKLVTKKNVDEVVSASFSGCMAAIDKAKTINGDMGQLKDAVVIYNNRNK